MLLNKGAAVNARSTNAMQNMPLHAAAAGKHAEIAPAADRPRRQRRRPPARRLDSDACGGAERRRRRSPTMLVAAGADVSARAENNQRPLDLALTKGQQQMVEFLEAHGAAL